MLVSKKLRIMVCTLGMALLPYLSMSAGIVGAEAQSKDLAERAKTIFTDRCFKCHGQNGVARRNIFVLDRERLISSKTLQPGNLESPLLRAVESDEMPLGGPPLAAEEKAALRDWVASGAPSWKLESRPAARPFISDRGILARLRDDLLKTPDRDRQYLRYFSIVHLYNAGADSQDLAVHRVALTKLVNSLSWHREITTATPIDEAQTLFRIDLRDYNWTAATWNLILSVYPYGVRTPDSEIVGRLSGVAIPYVRADWFIATASVPPLYHGLLGLPGSVRELEKLLGIDAARDIEEEKNVARAGIRASGVSQNNRVLERHVSPYGAYWKSFDFTDNLDEQNIFRDPLRLNPAGGEIIFNLPNGLQAYFLIDRFGRRLDVAPIAIVSDHNNPDDPVIRNGRSCMSCHYEGVQSFKDDVRPVVSRMGVSFFERDKALALYPTQRTLDQLIERDRQRFATAVEKCGPNATTVQNEPVNTAARRFKTELSSPQAAAEAGLEFEEFQRRLRANARLVALGFGQLLVADAGVKRDTWERSYAEVVRELGLGESIRNSPLVFRTPTASRIQSAAVPNQGIVRSIATTTDPIDMLRSAKTILVRSDTMFLKPNQLEDELRKQPEFTAMGLVLVRDMNAADLIIDLDRPVFTYTFTFSVTNPETSVLVTSGKVTAFDGNLAAPKIAAEVVKRLRAARPASSL
ncbi:MAG TPA: hypothetical protein VNS63_17140 [Blastocatellia bacterium]|nr:hypothetical protein [Blastocatellia bacterium]